ncbi:hypothetical protein [Hyphomicrobium sp.]|uniref:hypothetical protein n=1 Tax=Hyphomicrobium sp. TaxID=82 RepID=UPI001D5B7E90|nr:hypothetical protein [Hyphomicrobium sp.]MBY0560056.1 hypothetical protein [Hyphomicrobium sp.]
MTEEKTGKKPEDPPNFTVTVERMPGEVYRATVGRFVGEGKEKVFAIHACWESKSQAIAIKRALEEFEENVGKKELEADHDAPWVKRSVPADLH